MKTIRRADETGASAVEYGLLISGIAALIVAAVFFFGGLVVDLFAGTCTTVNSEAAAHNVVSAASCR